MLERVERNINHIQQALITHALITHALITHALTVAFEAKVLSVALQIAAFCYLLNFSKKRKKFQVCFSAGDYIPPKRHNMFL